MSNRSRKKYLREIKEIKERLAKAGMFQIREAPPPTNFRLSDEEAKKQMIYSFIVLIVLLSLALKLPH